MSFRRPPHEVAPLPDRWSARWEQAREWMALGIVFLPIGERLFDRYSEPGRHYHDARHVLACLDVLDNFPGVVRDNDAVELALWFHDAIYDVHAAPGKNEADSAEYFRHEFALLAHGMFDVEHICRLILATRHNTEPEDEDAALVMDIDLVVLAAEPPRYDFYADDVRKEYAHVDDEAYRKGRADVLRGFLDRKRIYHTRNFQKLFEQQARENMIRELQELGS